MKRFRRPSRRKTIGLTLFGVVLLIAAAWTGGFFLHDSSQATPVSEALRRFRASERGSGGLSGVYLYATKGSESINALGGTKHVYPPKTSITVIEVPCGIQLRWAALEKRSTTWTFCSTAAGIELRSSDERHAFFGQSDHAVYGARGDSSFPSNLLPARPGRSPAVRIGISRSAWRASSAGTVEVGGRRIRAIHVSTDLTIRSRDSGSESVDWWLDSATALPLRIGLRSRTSRKMWVGRVQYHEDLSLRLLSLKPMR